jgi:hypothetical protein
MTVARQYCQLINTHFAADTPIPPPAALVLQYGQEFTQRRGWGWHGTPPRGW